MDSDGATARVRPACPSSGLLCPPSNALCPLLKHDSGNYPMSSRLRKQPHSTGDAHLPIAEQIPCELPSGSSGSGGTHRSGCASPRQNHLPRDGTAIRIVSATKAGMSDGWRGGGVPGYSSWARLEKQHRRLDQTGWVARLKLWDAQKCKSRKSFIDRLPLEINCSFSWRGDYGQGPMG
jgi:hypothetical protein